MGHILIAFVLALAQGLQQSPDTAGKFNHAVELQRQGALKEAAAEYRALIAVQPNYTEAHANLGVVLAQLGQYEDAIASYESALRLAPNLTPIWLNLGIAHYRAGQFEKAADVLNRVLDKTPGALQARQLLGLALVELGRDAEAVTHLEQTLAAAPGDSAVLYSLGIAYMRLGRPGLRAMVDRLADAPGGLPAAHLLQGQFLLSREEYAQALNELNAAATLNTELPRLQYSLGLVYLKLGNHKQAIAAFENQLRRTQQDFSTLYYLAYLNEAEGNLSLARQQLDAALKLEPQSTEANALLGKILSKQGKNAEALGPLEKAVAQDPKDPVKRYMLARLYRQLGRNEDAAREFAEVQRLKSEQLKEEQARRPKP